MEWLLGGPERVAAFWRDHYQRGPHIFRCDGRIGGAAAAVETAPDEGDSPRRDRPWPPLAPHDMEEIWTNAVRSGDASAVLVFRGGKQLEVKTPFFAYPHDCSVVINKSDRFCAAVLALCEALEEAFPFVFCNVYLTPPGSQTVRVHSDDREVLAIQILGRKQWTVYGDPPVRLPYKEEEVGKAAPFDPAGVPVLLDDTVRPGDVLYLPRGYAHCARTTEEEPSLHLTMAIQTSDWDMAAVLRDGVAAAVRNVASASQLAREVLSPEALASAASPKEPPTGLACGAADDAHFKAALEETVRHLTLDSCAAAWRQRLASMRSDRRQRLSETLRPVPHPVRQETHILWNGDIQVVAMQDTADAPVTSIKFIGVMRRGDGSTMPLSLSAATKNVVAMMTTRHTKVPAQVRQLPLRCPLARLAVTNWLLRNGCFIRVD